MNTIFKLKTTFETEFTSDGPNTSYQMSLYAEDESGDEICIPIDVERLIDPVDSNMISIHVHNNIKQCSDSTISQFELDSQQLESIRSMVAIQNLISVKES